MAKEGELKPWSPNRDMVADKTTGHRVESGRSLLYTPRHPSPDLARVLPLFSGIRGRQRFPPGQTAMSPMWGLEPGCAALTQSRCHRSPRQGEGSIPTALLSIPPARLPCPRRAQVSERTYFQNAFQRCWPQFSYPCQSPRLSSFLPGRGLGQETGLPHRSRRCCALRGSAANGMLSTERPAIDCLCAPRQPFP